MPLEMVSPSTCTALSQQRAGGADRIGAERGGRWETAKDEGPGLFNSYAWTRQA